MVSLYGILGWGGDDNFIISVILSFHYQHMTTLDPSQKVIKYPSQQKKIQGHIQSTVDRVIFGASSSL